MNPRNVDIEKLDEKELLKVQELISKKISVILNKADKDANKILAKYGLKAQLIFELSKKDEHGRDQ
jgi:hypothetical protein